MEYEYRPPPPKCLFSVYNKRCLLLIGNKFCHQWILALQCFVDFNEFFFFFSPGQPGLMEHFSTLLERPPLLFPFALFFFFGREISCPVK